MGWSSILFVPLMWQRGWCKLDENLSQSESSMALRSQYTAIVDLHEWQVLQKRPDTNANLRVSYFADLVLEVPLLGDWSTVWWVWFKRCWWLQLPYCERDWIGHLWAKVLLQKTWQFWQIERLNNQNILQLLISNDLIVASLHACMQCFIIYLFIIIEGYQRTGTLTSYKQSVGLLVLKEKRFAFEHPWANLHVVYYHDVTFFEMALSKR